MHPSAEAADSCLPASAAPAFSLSFSANGNLAATGYIDYVDFLARARLVYRDRQLFISDSRSAGESAVTRFTIEGSSSLIVWDITDPFAPRADADLIFIRKYPFHRGNGHSQEIRGICR